MSGPCERCDGDGWVEVFGDEGFPVGARDCEECRGSGIAPFRWDDEEAPDA